MKTHRFASAAVALALSAALALPALAAAPTATANAANWHFDTNRSSPQGFNTITVGDINVSVAGTSTAIAEVSNGAGTATCEGFSTLAAQLQRTTVDPNGPYSAYASWTSSGTALAAVGTTAISEAGIAWYRWNITALTGTGNCVISWANK